MSKKDPPANGWEQAIEEYREDVRIQRILAICTEETYRPDYTISEELRTLLVFARKAEQKSRRINGPEDLENAQQSLNEIQEYRDRAVEICLSCTARCGSLETYYTLASSIISLRPEVQAKTEGVRKAVIVFALREVKELMDGWDSLKEQSKMVIKNCVDGYFTIQVQCEIAKQMWFQRQRVDLNADPKDAFKRG